MKKESLPIKALEALQPWINFSHPYLIKEEYKPNGNLIHISCKEYGFFFVINNFVEVDRGIPVFTCTYKPKSENSLDSIQLRCPMETIDECFKNWCDIISKYDKLYSPFENKGDIIFNQSKEEIKTWFILLDDDADVTQYDMKTLFLLDNLLNNTIVCVEQYEDNIDDNVKMEILKQAEELRQNLTRLTKRQVVDELSRIFAHTKKVGLLLFARVIQGLCLDQDNVLTSEETKRDIYPFVNGFIAIGTSQ